MVEGVCGLTRASSMKRKNVSPNTPIVIRESPGPRRYNEGACSATGRYDAMTIDELRREALGLDLSSRARLALELLSSLDDLSEAEIERLWLEESQRRLEEIASGAVETVSADEALAKARAARR